MDLSKFPAGGVVGALIILAIFGAIFFFTYDESDKTTLFTPSDLRPTDFSEVGTITVDNPGQAQGVMVLVYEKPGAPALTKELVVDAQSICATPDGATACMAISATYDMAFGGKRAIVEGVKDGDKVILRKLRILGEGEQGRPPTIGDTLIPWPQAVTLIESCKVASVMQAHSLDVYLKLKDGQEFRSVEPLIDQVFYVVSGAKKCAPIPVATE